MNGLIPGSGRRNGRNQPRDKDEVKKAWAGELGQKRKGPGRVRLEEERAWRNRIWSGRIREEGMDRKSLRQKTHDWEKTGQEILEGR